MARDSKFKESSIGYICMIRGLEWDPPLSDSDCNKYKKLFHIRQQQCLLLRQIAHIISSDYKDSKDKLIQQLYRELYYLQWKGHPLPKLGQCLQGLQTAALEVSDRTAILVDGKFVQLLGLFDVYQDHARLVKGVSLSISDEPIDNWAYLYVFCTKFIEWLQAILEYSYRPDIDSLVGKLKRLQEEFFKNISDTI